MAERKSFVEINLNLINKILSNSSITTFSEVENYIEGYCECVCFYENIPFMGLTEYKLFPGFGILLKNKYKLNKYKNYKSVFNDMQNSDEEKYSEFIDSLKEYAALPAIMRDPLYDEIYQLRALPDAFKNLEDVKNRLADVYGAFFDRQKSFNYDSEFRDFNAFVLKQLGINDETVNWADALVDRYSRLGEPRIFFRLYDDFCVLKSEKKSDYEPKRSGTDKDVFAIESENELRLDVKKQLPEDVCLFCEKIGFNNAVIKNFSLKNKESVIIFEKNNEIYELRLSGINTVFSNLNTSLKTGIRIIEAEFRINDRNQKQFELIVDNERFGFLEIEFAYVSILNVTQTNITE